MSSELPFKDYGFVRYVPMTRFADGRTMGLVTCTNLSVQEERTAYYMGDATELMLFDESTVERINATKRRPLLSCCVVLGSKHYWVGNTHFPYTEKGEPTDQQRHALYALIGAVENVGSMVLCAAMVMPRGGRLYQELEDSELVDLVPGSVTCTLDPTLHRRAPLLASGEMPPVVVDYIFGTGRYAQHDHHGDFYQITGIADHTPLVTSVS